MKKLLLLLSLCGYLLTAAAQTATDSNGDKIYRGNIAVFVREDKYVFDSKSPQQKFTKTPTKKQRRNGNLRMDNPNSPKRRISHCQS